MRRNIQGGRERWRRGGNDKANTRKKQTVGNMDLYLSFNFSKGLKLFQNNVGGKKIQEIKGVGN